jgi:hypothetical protein
MDPILQELDAQWLRLARSPEARAALDRWGEGYPPLAGRADLHEVLSCRRDPVVAKEVLQSLATLAPSDVVAARTLLQMLLPGLVALVGTVGRGDGEAQDELVALAWERIRTYPTTRTGSVAANVVLDVRKQYLKLRRGDVAVSLELVQEPVDRGVSVEDHVMGVLLVEGIAALHHLGLMSPVVLDAILRTRLGGERLADVAAEHGVDVRALCQRRRRAERRLRTLASAS